jgi:hypothetical protein
MSQARRIMSLCRVERLPTVWSHCLAGWWLGGGGKIAALPYLFAAVTLLFAGGGLLESAFGGTSDGGRDTPAEQGGVDSVGQHSWRWGLGLLILGGVLLLWLGILPGALGLVLVLLIVAHEFARRITLVAPVMEGVGRFLIYILASCLAAQGVTGWSIWCGLALAAYVAGVGWLENPGFAQRGYGLVLLLFVPVFLALIMDVGVFREPALLLSGVLTLWVVLAVRPVFWPNEGGPPGHPRELRPGLVLVDWLAACPAASVLGVVNQVSRGISFGFIALFVLAVLFRRVVGKG